MGGRRQRPPKRVREQMAREGSPWADQVREKYRESNRPAPNMPPTGLRPRDGDRSPSGPNRRGR